VIRSSDGLEIGISLTVILWRMNLVAKHETV